MTAISLGKAGAGVGRGGGGGGRRRGGGGGMGTNAEQVRDVSAVLLQGTQYAAFQLLCFYIFQ